MNAIERVLRAIARGEHAIVLIIAGFVIIMGSVVVQVPLSEMSQLSRLYFALGLLLVTLATFWIGYYRGYTRIRAR